MNYADFLAAKSAVSDIFGFEVDLADLHPDAEALEEATA